MSRPAAPIASIFLTLASWPEVAAADRFQYPAVPDGPAVAPGARGFPGPSSFPPGRRDGWAQPGASASSRLTAVVMSWGLGPVPGQAQPQPLGFPATTLSSTGSPSTAAATARRAYLNAKTVIRHLRIKQTNQSHLDQLLHTPLPCTLTPTASRNSR